MVYDGRSLILLVPPHTNTQIRKSKIGERSEIGDLDLVFLLLAYRLGTGLVQPSAIPFINLNGVRSAISWNQYAKPPIDYFGGP